MRPKDLMDIPEFAVAVEDLRGFLAKHGRPVEVFWVFRDDVWFPRPARAVVRFPPPSSNSVLAEKVYAEGRTRGLVSLDAVAATSDRIAATVWFPKFPEEAVQGWTEGLKRSIREPLPVAQLLGGWRWHVASRLPGNLLRRDSFLGTKRWAAA